MFPSPLFHQFLLLCFFALVIFAALSDLKEFRIPNTISLALLALYPLHVLASSTPVGWLMALAVGSLVFVAGLTLFFCGLVGGGDVKFLAATSLWAGASLTLPMLVVMGFIGGVMALTALGVQYVRRYRATGMAGVIVPNTSVPDTSVAAPKLPYGVAIAAGAFYAGTQLLAG